MIVDLLLVIWGRRNLIWNRESMELILLKILHRLLRKLQNLYDYKKIKIKTNFKKIHNNKSKKKD